MQWRHEWKHEIDGCDRQILVQRLQMLMQRDRNGADGRYKVRSLYFDDWTDRALREKWDGVSRREKFRIRCYNDDPGFIRLEKKSKRAGLCCKQSVQITAEQTQAIVDGDTAWLARSGQPLLEELHRKMIAGLRPKTIVDYEREAYIYAPGNVRVTFDSDIRTGLNGVQLLDFQCVTLPVGDSPTILEVKWDAFLPDHIRMALQLEDRRAAAFSKYAACRIYG